nr:MAG TPA: hypothetical protein [Caudoviricetes sp.]
MFSLEQLYLSIKTRLYYRLYTSREIFRNGFVPTGRYPIVVESHT